MTTDIHMHGYEPGSGSGLQPEDVVLLARRLKAKGTDRFLLTLYPAPLGEMRTVMKAVAAAAEHASGDKTMASVLGMHLEGPFLNPAFAGALAREHLLAPDRDALARLLEGFEAWVKVITLAPELPGALPLVEAIRGKGIAVSLGHSGATFAEAVKAKAAGATGVTHLFNAMRGIHHREPGLAGFALTDPDLYVEIVADGHHLSAWTLDLVFRIKPHDRIILVSDLAVPSPSESGSPPRLPDGRLAGGGGTLEDSRRILTDLGLGPDRFDLFAASNPNRYLGTWE